MTRFPIPRAVSAALALVALLAGATGATAASPTRVLSNVATVSWEAGGARAERASNRVDIAVEAASAASARVYHLEGAGADAAALAATRCTGAGGVAPIALPAAYADAAGYAGDNRFRAGEPVVVALDAPAANLDPAAADRLAVTVTTQLGDREEVTLTESGPTTGRFLGVLPTVAGTVAVSGDCRLTVRSGETLRILFAGAGVTADATADFLVDPYGIVFDSATGVPVSGARVSIVDADTGAPAAVFGDDGESAYPNVVISGEPVTDRGGTRYQFAAGEYRFPLLRRGRYVIRVEPPAPYRAPSSAGPAEIAPLTRPDGGRFVVVDGSYARPFALASPAPVRIDLPVDAPGAGLLLTKEANRAVAEPGDVVQYRLTVRNPDVRRATAPIEVTDTLPPSLRLRPGSVRSQGRAVLPRADAGGRIFYVPVSALAPGGSALVTYLVEVLPGTRAGHAVNRAVARDQQGNASPVADAAIRITSEVISRRLTIQGRVVEAACTADPRAARGVPGVRVMLEDGSYAVTDDDGRYHFEGVEPGTHVVQLDEGTLPATLSPVLCRGSTQSAGRAWSRFVEGGGGALRRVDFHLAPGTPRAVVPAKPFERSPVATDAQAAGAERDWLAGQAPGVGWVFPGEGHNPRARAIRVVVKHGPGQRVRLLADGKPVDTLAFDGTTSSPDGQIVISKWRGVPIAGDALRLAAEVTDAGGASVQRLERTIHYTATAARAELLPSRSRPIADGVGRPVIAVRLTDRHGRPVHHGTVGEFTLPSPYLAAVEADAQTARQLSGLERARPFWRVEGDDGVAYIELEPTTASGTLALDFSFKDGDRAREQRLETWLELGDRPWTVVGFAAGTVGFNRLSRGLEALGRETGKLELGGRAALYAKGRVSGRWLLTLAYDTGKREDETRFGGMIDPMAYYTVYADRSERRYDAQSVRKLYLKLERPQFYALFGDYETGITEPELTRYARALNGIKAEHRGRRLHAMAFAADSPTTHRRDEIQGNGLSGPYALRARDILPNSETIQIETRDRFRSNLIVETRRLSRHIDYDIDYLAGTLRFMAPILSRASGLDPQVIVADYEVDGVASRQVNAGGRAGWRTGDERLEVNATAIRDGDGPGGTLLGGVDVRYRPTAATELRAEVAASRVDGNRGRAADQPDVSRDGTALAWLVEAEHHGARTDVLAYARQQDGGFGTGQVNAVENGTRKLGVDGRLRLGQGLALSASAWHEDYLTDDRERLAGRALAEYRTPALDLRAGLVFADDRLADGAGRRSTLLQLGATKRLARGKLELDAGTEFALGGEDESIDFPNRYKVGARYAVTDYATLIAGYERADGDAVQAQTLRVGFDLKPWAGARFALTGNRQAIVEYGPRSFAAFGLSQSVALGPRWTVDLSLDGNETLGRFDASAALNPLQPVATGGFVGEGATLTEDFLAVTGGATYRGDRWSAAARAEYRAGERGDRAGVTAALLRQIGDGRALGAALDWHVAEGLGGLRTETRGGQLSWAHRPLGSDWSWLDKLELRDDRVRGAVAGQPGPVGGAPLLVDGNARSTRVVNSLSVNWQPMRDAGGRWTERAEASLFWGTRYASERLGRDDVAGWSNLFGAGLRFNLSDTLDVGVAGTVRTGAGADAVRWAAGPSLGVTPFTNGWLSIGYNFAGFSDRDFEGARYTRSGPYATMRVKLDQLSLSDLGLRRR